MADKNLIDAIARGIVVFDGAMGTTLQRMQLAGELTVKDFDGRQGCNEILSLTRRDVVAGVHRSYLEVGCDVVETNTFGGSRPKLDEFDLGARVVEVNEQAARIACQEADRAQRSDGRPRYVAGSLGPSGFLPSSSDPDLGRVRPAELVEIFREQSVPLLRGGVDCCGTTRVHVKQVVEAMRGTGPARKRPRRVPMLSSGLKAAALHQEPRPLIIGERVNSQGSKKMKELLLANDITGILGVAREQVEGGAHALDVCVALTERADEQETMTRVVRVLSGQIEAPLCIDSTEPEVIADALEWLPGIGIVNSVHLERGWEKIDKIFPLLKQYGACTVAMAIDEKGMALTRDRKLEVARRIYERALKDGLQPWQLLFDVLTFTLATGDEQYKNSAVETIEGIGLVKEKLPGALTVLGVSNVSFGLSRQTRPILNSVFLTHCLKAGLDAAIINPRDVLPWNEIPADARALAEDLVLARRDDALTRLIAHFEAKGPAKASVEEEQHFDTPEARLHHMIVDRQQKGLIEAIDECLKTRSAVGVINDVLLGAMNEVGDRFGAGELILPFVLQSAEVMKKAVAYLEQFMEKNDSYSRGAVVLATVFGDVHDIGKNLVKTILSNNGYTVH